MKVFIAAEGPVAVALQAVLSATAQVVPAIGEADIIVAFRPDHVLKALEDTQLPVWQLVYGDAVAHRRVRQFSLLDDVPKLMAEAGR